MNNSIYERPKRIGRLKDILTLSIFTVSIAVISTVIMNLIVYPVTVFAISNTPTFNFIVKDLFLAVTLILLVGLSIKKIFKLKNEDPETKVLLKYILLRPLDNFAGFIVTLSVITAVIFILYFLFSINYDFLSHITAK